jgi:hypothetical protein
MIEPLVEPAPIAVAPAGVTTRSGVVGEFVLVPVPSSRCSQIDCD